MSKGVSLSRRELLTSVPVTGYVAAKYANVALATTVIGAVALSGSTRANANPLTGTGLEALVIAAGPYATIIGAASGVVGIFQARSRKKLLKDIRAKLDTVVLYLQEVSGKLDVVNNKLSSLITRVSTLTNEIDSDAKYRDFNKSMRELIAYQIVFREIYENPSLGQALSNFINVADLMQSPAQVADVVRAAEITLFLSAGKLGGPIHMYIDNLVATINTRLEHINILTKAKFNEPERILKGQYVVAFNPPTKFRKPSDLLKYVRWAPDKVTHVTKHKTTCRRAPGGCAPDRICTTKTWVVTTPNTAFNNTRDQIEKLLIRRLKELDTLLLDKIAYKTSLQIMAEYRNSLSAFDTENNKTLSFEEHVQTEYSEEGFSDPLFKLKAQPFDINNQNKVGTKGIGDRC